MPLSDPPPEPLAPEPIGRRLTHALRWIGAVSAAVAALAVVLVRSGDPGFPLPMLIATAFGAGLSVLLGGALMTLIFLSNSSGHDAAAGALPDHLPDKDRP